MPGISQNPPVDHLLNCRDVATTLRVSTRTVWKMVACGDLPPPLKIGGARRWRKSDVQSFIEKLAAERDKH